MRKNSKRKLSDRYNTNSCRRVIQRAAKRAGVVSWSPNQLGQRRFRRRYGLDAAGAVLETTQVYAERDLKLAIKVAGESG